MIGQRNHEAHTGSRANVVDRSSSLNDTNDPTQVIGSQVDMHTLEKNIVQIDDTRGNITVEGCDLLANEKKHWPATTHLSQSHLGHLTSEKSWRHMASKGSFAT